MIFNLIRSVPVTEETPTEPTMYSYNGTVLPALPAWDKETYPYAVITCRTMEDGTLHYYFFVHEYPNYYETTILGTRYYYGNRDGEPPKCVLYFKSETDTGWVLQDRDSWNIGVANATDSDPVVWTNFTLEYADGTTHEASEPVPVYE